MSIERKAISALKWASAAKLVVQIVSWIGTLVVVRLLSPLDYGLMAKVAVVCAIAGAAAELGLETALVRAIDISQDDLRKIYGVSLLLGGAMTVAVALSAPLLARLFQEPRLVWPIAVASTQIALASLALVPSALATRELSFRRLSGIEMASGIASIAATLLLAVLGAGVWALVLGTLLGAVVRTSALLVLGERAWPLFSLTGIEEHMKFGLTVAGNRLSYFILVQSDVLIGSRFLSTSEIGRYSVALQLATLPMSKVMGVINQITLPAVAQQQKDKARVSQGVRKSIGLISVLAFPALWGISAVAGELVHVLFGPNWTEAVPALIILPLVVPLRMICSVLFTTSLALGNRQLDLRNTVVNFVLLPAGFYVGAHWGLIGLSAAWLISVPLAYCFSLPPVLRFLGLRGIDLAKECCAPVVAALLMYAAVAALREAAFQHPSLAALLALSGTGAFVYFAVMAIVSRRHLVDVRSLARALFAKGSPSPA